jgi:ribosome-binding factor A
MNRVSRVNQLIKKEISQLLLKEVDFPENFLVTVTRVETSANLIQAKVYLSVMPENQSLQVLETLSGSIYRLQQKLNRRLSMRPTPRIVFVEEKTTREAGRVEELLEQIKNSK